MAVRDGQVLGAVESMSVLYDVTAEVSGVVVEVLVEEGQPVEYGQELFRIQRAPDGESALA
jgi:biotin carboxyl carrier protein